MIVIFSENKQTKSFASILPVQCQYHCVYVILSLWFIHKRVCDPEQRFWDVVVSFNLSLIVCILGCAANAIHIPASLLVYIRMSCQFGRVP